MRSHSDAVASPAQEQAKIVAGSPPEAACTAASVSSSDSSVGGPAQVAIGEPGSDPVVANDPVSKRELLEERALARVRPLLLEVRHPASPEQEQRPLADRRVGDSLPSELAEADVLLHGPSV